MGIWGLDLVIFGGCIVAVGALCVAFAVLRGVSMKHLQITLKGLRNSGHPFER